MNNALILKLYIDVTVNHNWDLLYDILCDHFHFQSFRSNVKGKNKYIEYERDRSILIDCKTLHFFECPDKEEYYHIYSLTTYEPTPIDIVVHETIGIMDGHVCYSHIDISEEDQKKLLENVKKLGHD